MSSATNRKSQPVYSAIQNADEDDAD